MTETQMDRCSVKNLLRFPASINADGDTCEGCSSGDQFIRICLPCGHSLHDECISKYSVKFECPICTVKFFFEDSNESDVFESGKIP